MLRVRSKRKVNWDFIIENRIKDKDILLYKMSTHVIEGKFIYLGLAYHSINQVQV